MILTLVSLAAALQAAPPAAAKGPLAPAVRGQVICITPDGRKKRCRSIVAYTLAPDGSVHTRTQTQIDETLVMSHEGKAVVRGQAICRTVALSDIEGATFTVAGQPAGAEETRSLRDQAKAQYADIVGHELCTTYTARGRTLSVAVSLDGKPQPDVTDTAQWVNPSEGYKVAP